MNNGFVRACVAVLLILFVAACKVEIKVPAGGKVVSLHNGDCASGETCVLDISDKTFDDTFTAIPEPGFTFKRWKSADKYFCGERPYACRLFTTAFGSNEVLNDFLASNYVFHLEPEFVALPRYNVTYWRNTIRDINQRVYATDEKLYARLPDVSRCFAGVMSDEARARFTEAVNRTRALHSLPPVSYETETDELVQQASLVQLANNYLTHTPDEDDTCYSQAAYDGASSSNIYSGGYNQDPAAHLFGWVNDNNNVASIMAAGHRRWVLNPRLGYTSYGQTTGYASMKVFSFPHPVRIETPEEVEFIAVPHNNYPYVFISGGIRPTPWSFSYYQGSSTYSYPRHDYFSAATVTVRDSNSGQLLQVRSLYNDTKGYGLPNFLSWHVDDWEYDTPYLITVKNIALPNGTYRDISYSAMIDRQRLTPLDYALEAADSAIDSSLSGQFDDPRDLDSYELELAGEVTFSGTSEYYGQPYFISVYTADRALLSQSDSSVTLDLESGDYVVTVSPCDDDGLCYQNVQEYEIDLN